MAGPQDYLTVQGPQGASYSLPKFDLGSQIAQIPQSYQEGQKAAQANQQYARTRAIQTALPNGIDEFRDPQTGQYDYHGLVNRMVQVAGPEGAGMADQLIHAAQGSNIQTMVQGQMPQLFPGGQPQGQPQGGRMAPNAASGPGAIDLSKQPRTTDNYGAETVRTLATGIAKGQDATAAISRVGGRYGGPDAPLSPAQEADARNILGRLIGQGGQQPGTGTTGKPAPFAGNRDQQGAPSGPIGGGTVTQDGSTGQPTVATAPQERAINGPAVPSAPASPMPTGSVPPGSRYKYLQDMADTARQRASLFSAAGMTGNAADEIKRAEALDERAKQDPEYLRTVEEAKTGAAADTKYYDTVYRGLTGSATIAAQQKQNIALLRQIAESPNFMPGMGSELALGYQRLAAQFGINPTGAAPREVFNQLAARVLADQFSGMKSLASETGEQGARIFKPMLDIEEKANITANDSLEGVRAKLNLLDKSGDLMMHYGNMADDYKTSHGKLDASFNKQIRAEIARSRMGTVMPAASGAIQVAPAGQKSKAEVLEWARKVGLKSGDPFRTPAGDVRYLP